MYYFTIEESIEINNRYLHWEILISMKAEVIVLVITITLSSILVVTYAQIGEGNETSTFNVILYTQFEYRDSNGQLFAYVEEDDPFIPDVDALNNFLDKAPEQITKNVGTFDIITIQGTIKYDASTFSAKTTLGGIEEGRHVVYAVADHDGYPVIPGDTLKTTWTAIRPSR